MKKVGPTEVKSSQPLLSFAHTCSACLVSTATVELSVAVTNIAVHGIQGGLAHDNNDEFDTERQLQGMITELHEWHGKYVIESAIHNALYFTSITMFCRIFDSFEWYLKSIIKMLISSDPNLIGNLDNSKIPMSIFMEYVSSDFDSFKNAVFSRYAESVNTGSDGIKGFEKGIKFIENKINGGKKILDENEIKILRSISEIRNAITHEERIPLSEWRVLFPKHGSQDVHRIIVTDLKYIIETLLQFCLKIESPLIPKYYNEEDFPVEYEVIQKIISRADNIVGIIFNSIT